MATRSYSEFPESDSVDRSGGFRAAMSRIFGDAEHPLSWSVPIGTIAGIRIRLHLLFIVYAVAQVLWSINSDFFGPGYTSIAMAALFGLTLPVQSELAVRLRAIYTYGQPLVIDGAPPRSLGVAARVIRHVRTRDPVPGLPLGSWGRLSHFGAEFRNGEDGWFESETPSAQLPGLWRARRALSLFEHGPHKYIAALAPAGAVSEFGD